MPYDPREYTHFQFIAYEVPTSQAVAPGTAPDPVERLPVPRYDGSLQPIPQSLREKLCRAICPSLFGPKSLPDEFGENITDGLIRARRLAAVVDFAEKTQARARDWGDETLTIFMAPEFYFRPNTGPSNSYAHDTMLNTLQVLRTMFSHADFRNWLIVPGTIFWHQRPGRGDSGTVYYNTVPIIKGGAADAPFTFVHKKGISHQDGAPTDAAALKHELLEGYLGSWKEQKASVTTVDNRSFGVEVCLDHEQHTLAKLLSGWTRAEKKEQAKAAGGEAEPIVPPPELDIHLLTACGMNIAPMHTAAKVGGYILRVDGSPNHAPRSQLQQVVGKRKLEDLTATDWTRDVPQLIRLPSRPERLVCYARQQFP